MNTNYQQIRAHFDAKTITVYQAYSKAIALPAIQSNRFESPFSFNRMTWIKPSFLWLMERSNYGTKSNQEYILGIKLKREAWENILTIGVLTHPDLNIYKNASQWQELFDAAKIHIQWDPERNLKGGKLEIRSIQVGISRFLIQDFNEKWIESIEDYTPLVKKINQLRKAGKYKEAKRLLPSEKLYPIPVAIAQKIGIQ